MRPAISPDGKLIACWYRASQPDSPFRLGIIPFSGGPPAKIIDVPSSAEINWDAVLRWSSDGRGVAYIDHRGGVDNIWLLPIDGGPPKQVTDFKDSRIFSFDWSRDGRLLLSRGVQTNDVVLINDAK